MRADRQPITHLIAVDQQAAEGGQYEQREEDVQHAHAILHMGQPVADEQHASDPAEQSRSGQSPGDPNDQQDHDCAGDGRGDPPTPWVITEPVLTSADEPLAQWRVHDQLVTVTWVVLVSAVADQLPCLWYVMLLVEDRCAVISGKAQVLDADDATDHSECECDKPSAPSVRRHRCAQTGAGVF